MSIILIGISIGLISLSLSSFCFGSSTRSRRPPASSPGTARLRRLAGKRELATGPGAGLLLDISQDLGICRVLGLLLPASSIVQGTASVLGLESLNALSSAISSEGLALHTPARSVCQASRLGEFLGGNCIIFEHLARNDSLPMHI